MVAPQKKGSVAGWTTERLPTRRPIHAKNVRNAKTGEPGNECTRCSCPHKPLLQAAVESPFARSLGQAKTGRKQGGFPVFSVKKIEKYP
jgi:hypothetical protein